MGTTSVTPLLFLGDIYEGIAEGAYKVATAGEAIQLIEAGLTAVLPEDAWDLAEEILRATIDDHAWIEVTMYWARHRKWRPYLQCNCPSCLAGVTRRRRQPNGALIWYDE